MIREELRVNDVTTLQWFKNTEYLMMSMVDENNMPYCVPVSFALDDQDENNLHIYVHGARQGKKLDCIAHNPNVCLITVNPDSVVVNGPNFTTAYQSTMAYGKAEIVTDCKEFIHAMKLICEKYVPTYMHMFAQELKDNQPMTTLIKVTISEITGRENKGDL